MKNTSSHNMRYLAALALLLSAALPAGAQTTITNVTNANGNWTNPSVWVGGVAPVAGGSAGTRAQLTGNGGNVWVTNDVGSASTRQVLDNIGTTSANATLTISNGTFYHTGYDNTRTLRIGFNAPAGASNGGRLILNGGSFNTDRSDAAGTTIGNNTGNGLLEVLNGNFTTSGGIQMAVANGTGLSQGTLRVTGASASANVANAIQLGGAGGATHQNGRATVEVSNGGILTSGLMYLDSLANTRGTNGTTGTTPNAILTVNGGFYTNSATIRFGAFTNSRARIDLTGGGVIQAQRIETANTASNSAKLLTFNVSNGTLRVNELSLLDAQLNGGGALTIGDGTSASALELLGSTNAIVVTNGIAIAANSQLRHTTAADATVASAVSGAGSLVKSGTGTLTLSAANTYAGGTDIQGGTVALATANNRLSTTGSVSISNGATLNLSTFNQTLGAVTGAGTVTGSGGSTLIISNASGNNNFGGALAGTVALSKSGAGSLTLSGTSTSTGAINVTAGSLIVDGAVAGATTVSGSGVLSGSGTMGGAVTIGSGGTLAIGNSPGTMTFDQNLTLDLNSTSIFEINGFNAGEFDLALGGTGSQTVTFNGILQLAFANDFNTTGSVKIFDFDSYSGSFTSVSSTGLAAGYDATFNAATGIVTVVPEPSTYALLILAGAGLAGHVIRRRRH